MRYRLLFLFHLHQFAVADQLDAVILEVLMRDGIFHHLILPAAALPGAGDRLQLFGRQCGMDERFGDALRDPAVEIEERVAELLVRFQSFQALDLVGQDQVVGRRHVIELAQNAAEPAEEAVQLQ